MAEKKIDIKRSKTLWQMLDELHMNMAHFSPKWIVFTFLYAFLCISFLGPTQACSDRHKYLHCIRTALCLGKKEKKTEENWPTIKSWIGSHAQRKNKQKEMRNTRELRMKLLFHSGHLMFFLHWSKQINHVRGKKNWKISDFCCWTFMFVNRPEDFCIVTFSAVIKSDEIHPEPPSFVYRWIKTCRLIWWVRVSHVPSLALQLA